jgi:hypothetical protein
MTTLTKQDSGKKTTTAEVIVMFRGLNLPVTDNQDLITARGKELEPLYLRRKASPDAQQRNEADRWFKHLSQLKSQRPALLEIVYNDFIQLADTVLAVALNMGTNCLTPEVYAQLEKIALEQCNCDAPLARLFLEKYREEKGLTLKGTLVSPHLVEHLTAVSSIKGIQLSWKLPADYCDEVVLVRLKVSNDGKPAGKGKELCRGRRSEYMDGDVKPGLHYRYEAYSIWRGVQSQAMVICDAIAIGEIADVRIQWVRDHVELHWENPSPRCEVYIFRSSFPMTGVCTGPPTPLPDTSVEKLFKQKGKPVWCDREAATGTKYHYLLVAYFGPGNYSGGVSVSLHTPIPPPAVPSVFAEYKEGMVNITWEAARTAQPVEYVILRRQGTILPVNAEDGAILQTTAQTSCQDREVTAGKCYTYTVYTRSAEIYSRSGTSSAPVNILAEVTGLTAASGDGTIELHWQTPLNVSRVLVRRDTHPPAHHGSGQPVPVTGVGHARDKDLENGKTYHYLVSCAYRPMGSGEMVTKGIRIEASPDYLPTEVKDFTVQGAEKEVICTWTPPGHGQVVIIRSSQPHGLAPGQRLPVEQMDSLGKRITTGNDNAHDLQPDIREPYYSIFAATGSHAVAGGCGCGVVYPDITGLTYQTGGDGVILNWAWPKECHAVRILRKQGQWPESPDDPAAAHISCTRVDYKSAGEKFVDHIQQQGGTLYYTVYARVPGIDSLFFSSGKNPGCRATVRWQPWMTLRYQLSNRKNNGKKEPGLLLTWNIENRHKNFNGFTVVAGQNMPPSSPAEGIELFRWQPGAPDTPDPGKAWLDLSPVRERGWSHFYCKLITLDPAQQQNTLIIHPNTCLSISEWGRIHHSSDTVPGSGAAKKRFTVPRKVICPYCFDEFLLEEILFDSFSGGEPVPARYTLIDRMLRRPPQPPKNKWGQVLSRKLCPHNKHHLPFTAGMQESLVIGVIGAKYSGKSHYIASLVDQLSGQVGADFQASLMPVTDETADRYRREFYEPLFAQGLELPATIPNPPPLIYDFNLSGKLWGEKNNRTVTLALYDTAGEDLENSERVRQMVRYLGVASGIIFLVDPLQAHGVRESLPSSSRIPPREWMAEPAMIISRVLQELEKGKVLTQAGPLETPVAVVLSKCDILREAGLLDSNRLWNSDKRHVGYFNREIHDDMAGMMGECVQRWSLNAYSIVSTRFTHHAFFGVSATGCASDRTTHRYRYISPWRVTDPLLWLLAELGVIPVR